ncbi:hypothetical protein ACFYWN_00350 [Streptomyces sp. NPDC002917]|uniref:hypothetical protein n=1 Tax=Streptomyces sp. NPDC002917 TaxID=3364671 RepID=UPI003680A3F5
MRTLLALFRRGRGRHRGDVTQASTPVTRPRPAPDRYVIEAEEVELIRPYFLAYERSVNADLGERAA